MARRSLSLMAGSVLVAGLMCVAAPAMAASAGNAAHGTGKGAGASTLPMIRATSPDLSRQSVVSNNWSGYAANGSTYTSVSAYWHEPTGHCTSGTQYAAFWVGLDGYDSSTVEQTGTDSDCAGSSPRYYGWYEMYPANPVNFSNPVSPGDNMYASVTHGSGSSYTLVLKDETKGWSKTVHSSLAGAANSSAEVIVEAPCCTASGGSLPLADFGSISFTGAHVDGSPIGDTDPTQIIMADTAGHQQDSVTSLNPAGKGFSVSWLRRT